MKKCQKCKKEKENVESYFFYAGKTVGYDVKDAGFREIQTTTSYKIRPDPIQASICDDCINSRILRYWIISSGIIICLTTLVVFKLIALFFLLLVTIIVITVSYASKREDVGDRIAISVYQDEFIKQGLGSFFIRRKYSEMNPQALLDSFNKSFDKGISDWDNLKNRLNK